MNKLTEFEGKVWAGYQKNKPAVLSGFAIASLWGTIWYTYKHAPIAHDILVQGREDMRYVKPGDKESKRAVVKETTVRMLPHVLPIVIGGGAATACMLGSTMESNKRIATISAAYALSDSALKELNAKMNDILGEQKAKKVKDAIAQDHLKKSEKKLKETGGSLPVVVAGSGDVLCMDGYTGRFFYSNYEKIGQAINEISERCRCEMYVSLNEFYDALRDRGANLARVPIGDDFGWNSDDLMDRGRLPIEISACLTETNAPCLCVEYEVGLRNDYRNLH